MYEREVTVALLARLAGVGRGTVARYVEELRPIADHLQDESESQRRSG